MPLIWKDKQDGIDDILAEDINSVAHGVIELQEQNGDIEQSLDRIILIQESLIGGGIE